MLKHLLESSHVVLCSLQALATKSSEAADDSSLRTVKFLLSAYAALTEEAYTSAFMCLFPEIRLNK